MHSWKETYMPICGNKQEMQAKMDKSVIEVWGGEAFTVCGFTVAFRCHLLRLVLRCWQQLSSGDHISISQSPAGCQSRHKLFVTATLMDTWASLDHKLQLHLMAVSSIYFILFHLFPSLHFLYSWWWFCFFARNSSCIYCITPRMDQPYTNAERIFNFSVISLIFTGLVSKEEPACTQNPNAHTICASQLVPAQSKVLLRCM